MTNWQTDAHEREVLRLGVLLYPREVRALLHALVSCVVVTAIACGTGGGGTGGAVAECNFVIECRCNDGTTQDVGCTQDITCTTACASHGGTSDGGPTESPDAGDGG
jgi:hypothetical protein